MKKINFSKYKHIFLILLTTLVLCGCTSLGMRDIPHETLREKYANEQSQFIDIDGKRVHYRDEGEGPVLLMIHGMLSSLHTWDGMISHLDNSYRIIRFDVPGFGFSDGFDSEAYNVEQYIEFIEKFTAKMGVDKFTMLGNSIGGYLSWSYAIKHPESVEALVLFNAPAYPQDIPFILKVALLPGSKWFTQYFWPRFLVKWNIKHVYADDDKVTNELVDRYFEMMIGPGKRISINKIFRLMKAQSYTEPEGIGCIQAPALVIWGDQDPWVPSNYENWKKQLPSFEYLEYDNVGHVAMEEAPERSAKDVETFLQIHGIVNPNQQQQEAQ